MALKKVVESRTGVTFEYWRVMPEIRVDFAEGAAKATLLAWVSAATRAANKTPGHLPELMSPETYRVVGRTLELSGDDFTSALATGDLRAAFYEKLKALDFFAGAEDILEEE